MIQQNINLYLYGYKELANYFHITVRTLQNWHQKKPIPWEKMDGSKNSKVRIKIISADSYFYKKNSKKK